ncbi:MAG: hypothetical protein AABX28_00850, partial [Nanoarchaeota archaeon]
MQFDKDSQPYSYSVEREGGEDVLYVNYLGVGYVPNLADSPETMGRTVDLLIENPNVSRIVFVQQKNYNYDINEAMMLLELAHLYVYLLKQEKVLSRDKLVTSNFSLFTKRYNEVFSFLFLLKQDPIASYNELRKMIIEANISLEKMDAGFKLDQRSYISFLEKILKLLERTKLIQSLMPYIQGYQKGDREIYQRIFRPDVIPNFTFTRLILDIPENAEIISQYKIASESFEESVVTILRKRSETKFIYHLTPPENSLSE